MNISFYHGLLCALILLGTDSIFVFGDELNDIQLNDGSAQSDISRGLPTVSSAYPTEGLPYGSPGEKPTLYLGSFQILAMPFSPGHLPPNFAAIPTQWSPPSKKD
ncbi:uncharacterized protein LOC129565169 [Sitodiplosis mosellana]|uniref:uncharacterized protein LOC129565169 n=1 Tax=Sitodiplosis mosellana TaxID=263140 RepID=UPI002444C92F|nr:uncharacterized protein LOC129565169 [Sitodiplosis mosellana]